MNLLQKFIVSYEHMRWFADRKEIVFLFFKSGVHVDIFNLPLLLLIFNLALNLMHHAIYSYTKSFVQIILLPSNFKVPISLPF